MSSATTTPSQPIDPATANTAGLGDFSDRLPPMLVKELRQGLRARTFVGVFLGLQLFLGLVMLFATTATGVNGAGEVVSRIIFLFFSLAVLVVQPLRAINALHGEIKSTTIDLMVLTKLSARRIVAGKWAAIVGQTSLLFVSIIPYLILRYFFGGMNLFSELLALFSIFLFSTCLTALNVGVSANSAIIVRALLPLGIAVFMLIGCFGVCLEREFEELLEFFMLEEPYYLTTYVTIALSAIYIAWTAFGLGVSAIAPASENHSTLNRLITMSIMAIVGLIFYIADVEKEVIPFAIGVLALPGIVLGLTEHNFLMPRLTVPFIKRGGLGKLAGLILYPCVSSGIFFALLLTTIVLGISIVIHLYTPSIISGYSGDEAALCALNICCGTILFPAVVLCIFQSRIQNRLGIYIATLAGSLAIMAAVSAIAESTNAESAAWLFAWLPPMQFYLLAESYNNVPPVFIASILTNIIIFIFLLIHALRYMPVIREAESEALATCFEPLAEVKTPTA